MALHRRVFPFLVAAATGIVSGVYIFKPVLVTQESSDESPVPPNDGASKEMLNKADYNTNENGGNR